MLINTSGGICCGDRFQAEAEAGPSARIVLATPAAEKVYRSDGPDAELSVRLSLACGSELAWLPQETILYDQARIRRRFTAALAADARLLAFEAVVFGRTARGEEVRHGLFEDRWRISREGRLVYADTLRLSGSIASLLERPAIAGGGRAVATVLYVAPDAEGRLDEARELLQGSASCAGASAWNGLLAVRLLARDPSDLRRDAVRFLAAFRASPLPRVWQT
ncbi:MAG TPA: urease accessory protein UreD [Microvirga sp.]|nr:urease accessory protein UreD [Microvirga sp.]